MCSVQPQDSRRDRILFRLGGSSRDTHVTRSMWAPGDEVGRSLCRPRFCIRLSLSRVGSCFAAPPVEHVVCPSSACFVRFTIWLASQRAGDTDVVFFVFFPGVCVSCLRFTSCASCHVPGRRDHARAAVLFSVIVCGEILAQRMRALQVTQSLSEPCMSCCSTRIYYLP